MAVMDREEGCTSRGWVMRLSGVEGRYCRVMMQESNGGESVLQKRGRIVTVCALSAEKVSLAIAAPRIAVESGSKLHRVTGTDAGQNSSPNFHHTQNWPVQLDNRPFDTVRDRRKS